MVCVLGEGIFSIWLFIFWLLPAEELGDAYVRWIASVPSYLLSFTMGRVRFSQSSTRLPENFFGFSFIGYLQESGRLP
jgi:hypothetical protein